MHKCIVPIDAVTRVRFQFLARFLATALGPAYAVSRSAGAAAADADEQVARLRVHRQRRRREALVAVGGEEGLGLVERAGTQAPDLAEGPVSQKQAALRLGPGRVLVPDDAGRRA